MNRTQLTTLLATLAIVVLVFAFIIGHGHWTTFIRSRTISIGEQLIATTNSPHLVMIGPDLKERLARLMASPTKIEKALTGDEPQPVGDGEATSRLVLKNQEGERLGIRLKSRGDEDNFDVLSYWTPEAAKEQISHRVEKIPLH